MRDFAGDLRGRVSSTGQRIGLVKSKSNICVSKGYSLVSKIRKTIDVAANYWIPVSHILDTYMQSCLFSEVVITGNLKYSDTKRLSNE